MAWPALRGAAPPPPKTYRKNPEQGASAGLARERREQGVAVATASASRQGGADNHRRPRHTGQVTSAGGLCRAARIFGCLTPACGLVVRSLGPRLGCAAPLSASLVSSAKVRGRTASVICSAYLDPSPCSVGLAFCAAPREISCHAMMACRCARLCSP